uniref:ABC transporter substrate-binding protein n=1 Tax=uncultured Caulobacter sp. TaxID=158749 RepID=UPI0025F01776|nr:ABC transporter substrate-binding protein [uncultured Caulobacter sp.]
MKTRFALILALAIIVIVAAAGAVTLRSSPRLARRDTTYTPPAGAVVTMFPATGGTTVRTLTIEAATDVSFSRAFITDFQRAYPELAVRYVDLLSSALFSHAASLCESRSPSADLYLTVATDHLVRLANDGCATTLPAKVTRAVPNWAQWRRNVVAFSLEPGVFVYNKRLIAPDRVPRDHLQLIEALRGDTDFWRGRIGTYDIRQAGSGYVYASSDARQSATYGRLIESFGRSRIRTYCCSNEMVDAVAKQEILFAYNVQKSYAFAGARRDPDLGVVIPSDYQAMQTRSVMVTRDAPNSREAIAFVAYLTSARGQRMAAVQLSPLESLEAFHGVSPRLVSPVAVGPVLLGLDDQARRNRFIEEWTRAITPADPASR